MSVTTLFYICGVLLVILLWLNHNNEKTLRQVLQILTSLMQDRLAGHLTESHLQELISVMDAPGMHSRHFWRLVFFRNPKWLYPTEIHKRIR